MTKIIALAWFAREDYDAMKKVSDDELPDTFDEWEADMTQRMAGFKGIGVALERVIVGSAKLKAWADENGLPVNTATRAAYAGTVFELQSQERHD